MTFDGVDLWITDHVNNRVIQVDRRTGGIKSLFAVVGADGPWGIAFDGVYLWIVFYSALAVRQYDVRGNLISSFAVGFNPRGIAFDGEDLWVKSNFDYYKYNRGGGLKRRVAVADNSDLCFDGAYLWSIDYGANVIRQRSSSTLGLVHEVAHALNASPGGITFDGGSFWIAIAGGVGAELQQIRL